MTSHNLGRGVEVLELVFRGNLVAKELKLLLLLNSQGRNLGHSVTPPRTSGLSSIQGDLGDSGKGIFTSQSY